MSAGHAPYLNPPQAAATPPLSRNRYPPSPYTAPRQEYTTVPLRDASSPVPLPSQSGRGTPSPLPSGANTPNGSGNRKKPWNFLPMHSSTASLNGDDEKRKRPKAHRTGSWDLLGERAEWEEYNPAQASVENLRFAEGDVGTNKVGFLSWGRAGLMRLG